MDIQWNFNNYSFLKSIIQLKQEGSIDHSNSLEFQFPFNLPSMGLNGTKHIFNVISITLIY